MNPEEQEKAVIHWRIEGREGHGEPVDRKIAEAWCEDGNKNYGTGTHWLVRVPS